MRVILAYEEKPTRDGRMLSHGSVWWAECPVPVVKDGKVAGLAKNIRRENGTITAELTIEAGTDDIGIFLGDIVSHTNSRGNQVVDVGQLREITIKPNFSAWRSSGE